MAKPTKPRWADGDASYVIEPAAGKKTTGWLSTEKPPFQYMNWVHKMTHDWIVWFESNYWSKQDITLMSDSPVSWDGADIDLADDLEIVLRYETADRRINKIAAGTLSLANGECLVAKFDYTNPSPATLALEAVYANLGANEYCIVAEASLTLSDEETERIIFRRRGALLEIVPLGLLVQPASYSNLGSGLTGPETYHGGAVGTTDATVTPIVSIPVAVAEAFTIEATITAQRNDESERASWTLIGSFYRLTAGNVLQNGGTIMPFSADSSGLYAVDLVPDAGTQTIQLQVTGVIATNIEWTASVKALKVLV